MSQNPDSPAFRPKICNMARYRDKEQAEDAVRLLKAAGVRASTNPADLGRPDVFYDPEEGTPLCVLFEDYRRARKIIDLACVFARPRKAFQMPPVEGTVEFVDMMVHDCRQYLLIAEGQLKDISEEGELELDEPTNDLFDIAIRLKRLKAQCARQAGIRGLDWQHNGGFGPLP